MRFGSFEAPAMASAPEEPRLAKCLEVLGQLELSLREASKEADLQRHTLEDLGLQLQCLIDY